MAVLFCPRHITHDLMVGVTKLPIPKHVGLALHILKQTGSKELVTILQNVDIALVLTMLNDICPLLWTRLMHRHKRMEYTFLQISNRDALFGVHSIILTSMNTQRMVRRFIVPATSYINIMQITIPPLLLLVLVCRCGKNCLGKSECVAPMSLQRLKDRRDARLVADASLTSLALPEGNSPSPALCLITCSCCILFTNIVPKMMILCRESLGIKCMTLFVLKPSMKLYLDRVHCFPNHPHTLMLSYLLLITSKTLTQKLDQSTVIITADQAIYDIVKGELHLNDLIKYLKALWLPIELCICNGLL